MASYHIPAFMAALLLVGCAQEAPPTEAVNAPPFQLVTDMQHTMRWILDPAADVIWDSAGTIITAEGRQELAPTTDEGWESVAGAAGRLAEAGNLLMLPGRSQGDDWIVYSAGLTEAAKLALEAAQTRDADALFDAGGNIYQVCLACHNQYWVKEDSQE